MLKINFDYIETFKFVINILGKIITPIALFVTYQNLREIKKQFYEQNRGNVIVFIEREHDSPSARINIKNIGNSYAKIIKLEIEPLIFRNTTENFNNTFLSPNQIIYSDFEYKKDEHKLISVKLEYETCNKRYKFDECLSLKFYDSTLKFTKV